MSLQIPESFVHFKDFYSNRTQHYKEIAEEIKASQRDNSSDENDGGWDKLYNDWYLSGGWGYEPTWARSWILNNLSLSNFRGGTCLDVGSGDGFWSWVLSEWCDTTGVDPLNASVVLSEAVRKRMHPDIQNRTKFLALDALEVKEQYDVVFCRAPSFLNYPVGKPFSIDLLDHGRKNLEYCWLNINGYSPEVVKERLKTYPSPADRPMIKEHAEKYADNGLEYLDKMLSITNKYFVFILSSKSQFYGQYLGDTYNHDPQDLVPILSKYGKTNIRNQGGYTIAEVFK